MCQGWNSDVTRAMPAQRGDRYALLFVCLGNICRSPLAEALFVHHAQERGVIDRFDIDSCGTGHWHVGGRADPRSIAIGAKYGVDVPSIARQVDPQNDFDRFDLLLAMDRSNRDDLIDLGADPERVRLMLSIDPANADVKGHKLDVPDPYYGRGDHGFERVYAMLDRATSGLLDKLI